MNWLQLAYQYGVGGLFFAVTLVLCLRPGGADLRNPADRRAFITLIAGFFGYLLVHALWIVVAARA